VSTNQRIPLTIETLRNTQEIIGMKNKNTDTKERGQAIVELATSMVILLTLLAGVVDLGRALFTWITLRDAAQEGASYASVLATEALDNTDFDPDTDVYNVEEFCGYIKERARITSGGFVGDDSTSTINLAGLIGSGDVTVSTVINGTECKFVSPAEICMGAPITVTVSYSSFPVTMPFMGTILGTQSISINANVVDSILTPPCQ
jgi:Flp pilus assembly protein TadG